MIHIKPFSPDHKEELIAIFKSNIPLYFAEHELNLFSDFLDRDLERGLYYLIYKDEIIVGSGGIALNNPTKYTNEPHVIMTWGMIDNRRHKEGFGKALLKYRIEQSKKLYPNIKIALGTTQHTFPFFEKYGFKIVAYEKDHWAKDLDLYQMELI